MRRFFSALLFVSPLLMAASGAIAADSYRVLYSFTGNTGDGEFPAGKLLKKGSSLYGTTELGGEYSIGAAYRVSVSGGETSLYSLSTDTGWEPYGGLVSGNSGNLYGTASVSGQAAGTIFKLATDGTLTVAYAFTGSDGAEPDSDLVKDKAGNLYGTTAYGGAKGDGEVFKFSPNGTLTVLHSFSLDDSAGYLLQSGVLLDKKGNIFGTTREGGSGRYGTVFRLSNKGKLKVLHSFGGSFSGGSDGATPGTPIEDAQGNLYGTAASGGNQGCYDDSGCGVIYKITPDRTEKILYTFTGGSDGGDPLGELLFDSAGNLYGTAAAGGSSGYGTVFKLDPAGKLTVLHAFLGSSYGDGAGPQGGLIADGKGNLFGSTGTGGSENDGTVFTLKE